MNKNILIVVYDFPPEVGGGGVMRTVKFLKYLKNSSYKGFVLTVRRRNTHMPDASLFHEVSDFEITRVKDILNFKAGGILQDVRKDPERSFKKSTILFLRNKFSFFEEIFLVPDKNVGWILPALVMGVKLVKEKNIDLIYATAPPFSSFVTGFLISKFKGKKLVIDYRDSWNGNPIFDSKYKLKNYFCRQLEKIILCRADAVIFTTENIKNNVIDRMNIQPKKDKVIWNGYDEDDFIGFDTNNFPKAELTISYLGSTDSIYGDRSPKNLLEAFRKLNETHNVELKFIGAIPSDVKEYVINNNINNVCFLGTVDHPKAIRYIQDSNILVVLLPIEQDGLNCVPGKTYEYIRSQRPILAITPPNGQLGKLICDYNAGLVVSPEKVDEIYDGFKVLIEKLRNNCEFYKTKDVKFFSRKRQFETLINFLSDVK